MAILDPLFNTLARFVRGVDDTTEAITNPQFDDVQATEVLGSVLDAATPADDIGAVLVDTIEEAILADLQDTGQITPENVEAVTDATEGGAAAALAGIGSAGTAAEVASLGQVETHQEVLLQALAGLGIDDVTGLELEARVSEGIMPALEAKVNAEHRSQFANLQDVIERDLRNKDDDTGYISDISEYGLRPDQVPILEEVALNDMEFEELIETPAELGLVVSDEVLQAELDRAGYSEQTKEFLQQVNDRIPLSARAYQELIVSEDHIADLDIRVEDGTLTPDEAIDLVPDQVDVDEQALSQRWQQKANLEPQAPSQAEFIDSLVNGYVSLEETRQRLQQDELDTNRFEDVLRVEILGEVDGAMQEAVALGNMSEGRFSDLAGFAGLDDEAVNALLSGQSLSDITKARLADAADPTTQSVRTIIGVGESRGQALIGAGVETVADLANANPQEVADIAQVSPETAQQWIDSAQRRQIQPE